MCEPLARSRASTKVLENAFPYAMLSEQPAHSNPSAVLPRTVRSQPHLSIEPELHARVTEWATPADDSACTNAASRVPKKIRIKEN